MCCIKSRKICDRNLCGWKQKGRATSPLYVKKNPWQEWYYTSVQADTCFYWLRVQVVLKTFASSLSQHCWLLVFLHGLKIQETYSCSQSGVHCFLIKKNESSIAFKYSAVSPWKAGQTNGGIDKGGNKGSIFSPVVLSLASHHQPCPRLMERFKGCCPHSLLLLCFSLDECDLNSHISLLFFHSDSLSHELKEEPIDFPIA